MFKLFFEFVEKYGSAFKFRIVLVLLSAVVSASLEVMGVALLYPLVTISMNPDIVMNNGYIKLVYDALGFSDTRYFVVFIAFCVGMSFIIKNIYMLFQQKFQFDMVRDWRNDICKKLMSGYIHAPMTYHLTKNSANVINNLTAVVSRVVNSYLIQCVMFISNAMVCFSLLLILMIKYSGISLITALVVGVLLWLQMKVIRRVTHEVNTKYVKANQENISILTMSLAGIKDTKLIGKESVFLDKYDKSNQKVSEIDKTNMLIQYIPIYLSEAILMFGIIIFICYILMTSPDPAEGIASITLLAAIAIRLAPMMNRLLYCYSQIKSSGNAVETIIEEFQSLEGNEDKADNKVVFNDSIDFSNVHFSYLGKDGKGIQDVNVTVNKGEFIGVVGTSGAGKTTFADVLSGLLPINSGQVNIDGKSISLQEYKGIRNSISYVSQAPFILNGSLRENVAFGVTPSEVDAQAVIDALRKAGLSDVLEERGMDFNLGENGKNLSGGQRQRVVIARALYFNRDIIVLDEATSALDAATEHDISNVIASLKGERTVIVIAHRLSTLKNADRLIIFDNGTAIDTGHFDDLVARNDGFRKMVELSRY
ncbi:ABC transporter ATP-binding protein [Vibrio mimicus]|uniref:ABC transporter ATP-binding protein n=1 Tax=Vibrio mimicus TaxID=674 RepID=UPI0011D842C0|nr:ABC transporter ATP-binding protein [Vibrio mimicus]TXY45611.1 ABC transporter ATP-binding protein [Vibrio mimicus]BCN22232.1 protein glycosylation K [Vibrio mimicus]BCN22541.1 protein glycosylation K [Vibrio mimicus]